MIGIVIVSHSARLAEGVLELAAGMARNEVKMAAAGGLDLEGRPLGTDPVLILKAIEEAYSEDGVLVLMDMGSALLGAEMALEMLPEEKRRRVVLCDAPLVEGAVSAAVQAGLGVGPEEAAREARLSLAVKAEHLGLGSSAPAGSAPAGPGPKAEAASGGPVAAAHRVRVEISNRNGLHARPAARFVQTAGRYGDTEITVKNLRTGAGPVNGKSINSVAILGARRGDVVEITASGRFAAEAVAALHALALDGFGEREGAEANPETSAHADPRPPLPSNVLFGRVGSAGIAIGPARRLIRRAPEVSDWKIDDPEEEWNRFSAARAAVRAELVAVSDSVKRRGDEEAARIFQAHLLFLDDPALIEPARKTVFTERLNAAAAWKREVDKTAEAYRRLDDEYLRARAADLEEVGERVAAVLLGTSGGESRLAEPGILVVSDLSPAEAARLEVDFVRAVCTAGGAATSHGAILARSLGIPALMGLGPELLAVEEGKELIVDAEEGHLIIGPSEDEIASYTGRLEALRAEAQRERALRLQPAVTRDGRRVAVWANVGSLSDARAAVEAGAEGVGLLRTEFLFLDREKAPEEEEQFAAYSGIAAALDGRPVVIRTLDAGGDKPLPYLDLGMEVNPFLGNRAIRLCLANPELFKTQLRAIIRTATLYPVRVMFPMVATLSELRRAKALLAEAERELRARGEKTAEGLQVGMMVEIPSAAVLAPRFAREADFFSIGTNDLTQYTMAAERGNPRVAELSDPLDPAVVRLIKATVEAAHEEGKPVCVCGELGGDVGAASLLLGFGIDELSMSPAAIPKMKDRLRNLAYEEARLKVVKALTYDSASGVRSALG